MSDNKNIDIAFEKGQTDPVDSNIAASSAEVSSVAGSVKTAKTHQRVSSSSERQIKFERAQKCLENAALVSKRIKEHRKATAELLGRPFEEDDGGDTSSEITSTMSVRTGYSAATDTSTTMSVQDALNIPGISESLANTLKQKEILMERIKQYKEITKRSPIAKPSTQARRESTTDSNQLDLRKSADNNEQLINAIREKENTLSVMQVKMKAMETTILDLQEMINEKDQIIEAKNMATTLMSDSLSKKDKDSFALLEDTKHQMTKMQENFVTMESEWKEEKQRLLKNIETKEDKIKSLEEANTILETSRFEISVENSKLLDELESKSKEITQLEEKIQNLAQQLDEKPSEKEKDDYEEEKGSREISDMEELTKKIELLEQLNCQLRQTNKELENKLAAMSTDLKPATGSPSKKGSPLPARKGVRNTASKQKSPWSKISSESLPQESDKKQTKSELARLEMLVQSLNKEILDKEYVMSEKDAMITELQNKSKQKDAISARPEVVDVGISTEVIDEPKITQLESVIEKRDVSVTETFEEQPMSLKELEQKLKEAHDQMALLNNDIDAANKNMIKVKSSHKLKLKQMQKTIDNFSKVSDGNAEIVKLNEELHQLSQKVAELEEEKGNLQLHLVDYDSGRLTESDVYKKLVDMENLAETRLKAISVLETQKFDLVQELHTLQQKNIDMEDKLADISHLQSEQVSTEIKSVQLEEQIDALTASKKELELIIVNFKLDKDQLNSTIKQLQEEKEELHQKLENYIQENMDLADKLEKLSAEKVSSAESIEIVESLTTQEKLELEEYNKGMVGEKRDEDDTETVSPQNEKNIENLIERNKELSIKIKLFTEEREEVMERMSKITNENESLLESIREMKEHCTLLQSNIAELNKENDGLHELNQEYNRIINDLKRERIEIIKETVEITKPVHEDTGEVALSESQHDDKLTAEKGMNRTKSVKQLTKEILKLKNTIKEREAEIGDCQMKILSLEEQQQKQNEIMQANANNEIKLKSLIDENHHLKEELEQLKKNEESEQQQMKYQQAHEHLQQEVQKMQQEYSSTISVRDARINELESILMEYEKQIFNYSNSLQQKDKDLAEYINQITKLNDVSQKLKSTIDLLEEEKAKDQNAELVKSLNKQIAVYQKKMVENEEKLRILEEEKSQLMKLKSVLENKNLNLEKELQLLQETFTENQNLIKELQALQQKHTNELSEVNIKTKDRDEEIHEIKLQLRKESIENEKLRNAADEKEKSLIQLTQSLEDAKEKVTALGLEKENFNQQCGVMETKNKELLEKLKKFALSIKKKSSMYTDLENQFIETQKQLQAKNDYLEQLSIQVDTLPALHEKLKHAEEEINRVQSLKVTIDQQKSQEISVLQNQIKSMEEKLLTSANEITQLNDLEKTLQKDLRSAHEENTNLKSQIDSLSHKIVEHEIEQKNNMNLITKVSSLESEINQKQNHIVELLDKLEYYQQQQTQIQFGTDAKIQERDLYIESLETEIQKYKGRIGRLEESISVMEDRRHTLERKADQLGNQLQEKQKAYTEYSSQEDKLISRLAVLMDHDRVVEKQLHEIDNENKELQLKIQQVTEDNQRLRKSLSDIQEYCNTLVEKASKADIAEADLAKYQVQAQDLEAHLKQVTHEHQILLTQKKKDIDELESEFNTQIENAFREKKALGEKYEKVIEHVSQIECKLNEYKTNNENLKANLQELDRMNQELISEKSSFQNQTVTQDYTDQYITEINNLNAVINNKNQELLELRNGVQALQSHNLSAISNLESKISELSNKLQDTSRELDCAVKETNDLKQNNEYLQSVVSQKDDYIKELTETKTLTFEMNIPKTEGMIISSTIESMNAEPKPFDMSILESQIMSDTEISQPETKQSERLQKQSVQNVFADQPIEPAVVAKKAYLCYQDEDNVAQDPFNSDEGWGLGECEEALDVTPGFSHLNEQIQKLTVEKDKFKSELESSNIKLIKALKKLKELKSTNEVLTNELRISKQVSQSSFLDSAIEDELRLKVEELEKKIAEINADINKERKEKEYLRKQNEIFNNANDRLTEIKEKLENELELWKYKFKKVNDRVSTLQWGSDAKDLPRHEPTTTSFNTSNDKLKEEMLKIEKENDELHQNIDQLTSQNNEFLIQQTQLKHDIESLNKELLQRQSICENCEVLKTQVSELQNNNTELIKSMEILNEKLREVEVRCNELIQNYDTLKYDNVKTQTELQSENKELTEKCVNLENAMMHLKNLEYQSTEKVAALLTELEDVKSKVIWYQEQQGMEKDQETSVLELTQNYASLEEQCLQLKQQLQEANNKVDNLKTMNDNLTQQNNSYSDQINELNSKMQNLNNENDNLLSTVAELRNSVSSAVDQRGFEIAELWKQHLAQRENDFQKVELELRNQVSASEAKYEQLLDSVQSSSQEETNKLVTMEQVSSLQSKLHDKEEHLRDLQDKYSEAINQLDILRSEMQDEKITHESKILEQQEEYEKVIQDLNTKNKENSNKYEETLKTLHIELEASQANYKELVQQVEEMTNKVTNSEEIIVELENKLKIKDNEVQQKVNEFTIALSQRNGEFENVRQQLIEYEKAIEDLNYEKEAELAVLRIKMHENSNYYENMQGELEKDKSALAEELQAKITECISLNKQITDLNKTLEEHSNKASEMQSALENQELEIVTLKDEITNLESLLRSTTSKINKHVSFASDTKPAIDDDSTDGLLSRELLDAVPRAELDLALYMLHQRDVRCEELTMELTQLLEERDTLQLRLSDSLRVSEELKMKCKEAGLDDSIESSQEAISELPSFSVEKEHQFVNTHRGQTSRSSSISDNDGDKPKLQAKLSQLRSVRHSRDVLLRHESESRQLDMRLLQRDVALLPAAAVDQLAQAHHTLSRDSQSTSTVLLNWLRGKSTPKVVHM